MRKTTDTKKFSPHTRLLWYAAALSGMLLFCLAPIKPAVTDDATAPTEVVMSDPAQTEFTETPADAQEPDGLQEDAAYVFLMQGDCGSAVYRLQTQLTALGYDVGDCTGVYTLQTASAVRRFQLDCGLIGDGVCTAAVSYAAAYLCGGDTVWGADLSDEQVCDTLQKRGYWQTDADPTAASLPQETLYRNALILFQRTHGLCGTGTADYATLCALGLLRGDPVFGEMTADGDGADAALFDLRCRRLTEALAEYVLCYPKASDLYTLTACAAVLCNRVADTRFPGSFDAVCATGLLSDSDRCTVRMPGADAVEKRARDLLLIRAAEDALRTYLSSSGGDFAHGALYVRPADAPLEPNASICMHTGNFVFFR